MTGAQGNHEQKLDPAIALSALDGATPREPHRQFALKHEDCFVVADAHGDIRGAGDGFFRDDTRMLSLLRLYVDGHVPSLLGASLSQDNILFRAHLSNRTSGASEDASAPPGTVHISRTRLLWENRLYEQLDITNYWTHPISMPLRIEFGADFRDMFEVRGSSRARRGRSHDAELSEDAVVYRYVGLDDRERQAALTFSQPPHSLTASSAEFACQIAPHERCRLHIEVGELAERPCRERFRSAAARARWTVRAKHRHGATVASSGRVFNDWLTRARSDIALLTTTLETGPYPYAGIPWFSTAFGRDGVITAIELLWLNPALALGVLAFLAQHQATEVSAFSDSEPGKIMHETRKGEMAILKELPFGRYYGGVDTTPLYVDLACAYAERTGDLATIDRLWPSLQAAASWMEEVGKRHPDGFITYKRGAETGLANQGWKDSWDSISHADGRIPPGPIALVEVQGYAYSAFVGLAALAERREQTELAEHWRGLAERLRRGVEERFWLEDLGTYALAIDGEGEPCAVRASNAGHLLYVGLPSPERAARVIENLVSPRFFTGWGIRTLADVEVAFNPMSYHNGSVWPHDTAVTAAGIARYGARQEVVQLLSGMFEAAVNFQMRLPELFCGFERRPGEAPISYPVACLPQAWSAGSAFMLIQACLGLRVDGWTNEIQIERPRLPMGIDNLSIRRLPVGDVAVDLHFQRVGDRIVCYLDQRHEGLVPLLVRS
ncbi:amylo-alpha-1,6-glucosidase [Arvimicrobium flavum]|uniref:amylo-alpha-1,6-glucosidase n=1 Tax=Arvimicrobium flavum TaxID=3393320 RepID=UPI00237BAE55|nr:amylo-alpha-1,6-glucosidase [Mesorhizobium shangrilense]